MDYPIGMGHAPEPPAEAAPDVPEAPVETPKPSRTTKDKAEAEKTTEEA